MTYPEEPLREAIDEESPWPADPEQPVADVIEQSQEVDPDDEAEPHD